jgi:hypothetical protein
MIALKENHKYTQVCPKRNETHAKTLLTSSKINLFPNQKPPNFPAKNPNLILESAVQSTKKGRGG